MAGKTSPMHRRAACTMSRVKRPLGSFEQGSKRITNTSYMVSP